MPDLTSSGLTPRRGGGGGGVGEAAVGDGGDVGVLPGLVAAARGGEPQLCEAGERPLAELAEPGGLARREGLLERPEVADVGVVRGDGLGHIATGPRR